MRLFAAAFLACGLAVGVCVVAAAPVDAVDSVRTAPAASVGGSGVTVARMLDTVTSSAGRVGAADNPAYLERILNTGPVAAHSVRAWWSALAGSKRISLEGTLPALIGNLDGLPADVRTRVNERELRSRMATLRNSTRSEADPQARTELNTLRQLQRALVSKPGQPRRSLLSFDDSGSMLAAIAIGDLTTARHIGVLVPGMLYSVQGQAFDWAATASVLDRAERSWANRVGTDDQSVATIAWLGYQTPDLVGAVSLRSAEQGARHLQSLLSGLRAARTDDEPYIAVIAHSYGSTVALLALEHGDIQVDALALLGSPGSDARSARILKVRNGNVYVAAAALDPIAGCGFFGSNPYAAQYGAHRMAVDGGVDPVDGRALSPAVGHNGYFGPQTESMRNLALIAIGRSDLVVRS